MKLTLLFIASVFLFSFRQPTIFYYRIDFENVYFVTNGDSTKLEDISVDVLEIKGEDVQLFNHNKHQYWVRIDFDYELGKHMKLRLSNYVVKPNGNKIKGRIEKLSKAHRLGIPCQIQGKSKHPISKIRNKQKHTESELRYSFSMPY